MKRLPQLPAVIKQEIANAPASSALERAKAALRECINIDQAKEIADEAKAIARYAAEKKGAEDLLRMARQIQVRAFRHIGQLLKQYKGKLPKAPMAMENVALRISSMDESSFERALAEDNVGLGPNAFAYRHIPRPPPVYSSDPKDVAKRARRLARMAADGDSNRTNWALRNFHNFIKTIPAQEAAAVFEDLKERARIREQIRELQDWLDELERWLSKRK